MSIKSSLSFLTRALAVVAPLAALVSPIRAAPVANLGAVCSPASITIGETGFPQSCTSATAQATVTPTINFFGNGFTISIDEQGFATSVNGKSAGFAMFADVPVNVTIAGPGRPVVIVTSFSEQVENLGYPAGTIGEIDFGFGHRTVITRRPDGGAEQDLSYRYVADPRIMNAISGPDFSSTYGLGWSVELNAMITSGSVAAYVGTTNTVQIFEADGVTPVSLVAAPEPSSALLILPVLLVCYLGFNKRRSICEAAR
jgi:hypothetical protein